MKLIVVPALAAVLLGSCSIKESRVPCPSYLNVSYQATELVTGSLNLFGWSTEQVFRSNVELLPEENTWMKPVHKDIITVAAVAGMERNLVDGHQVLIPYGNECDRLYGYKERVDCTGEEAFAVVRFRKQFCTVHLDINQTAEVTQTFRFEVDGCTAGFDVLDFSAVEGRFHCEPRPVPGEKVVDFRIPRQVDNSMTVSLWTREDQPSPAPSRPSARAQSEFYMGTFPLGEYISKTGYDWTADALQDIYVRIDFLRMTVVVSVAGWEDGVTFTFVQQ